MKQKFKCYFFVYYKDRPDGGLTEHKMPFAHPHEPMKELGAIVKELKPSVLKKLISN